MDESSIKDKTKKTFKALATHGYVVRATTLAMAMKQSEQRKRKIIDTVEENLLSGTPPLPFSYSQRHIDIYACYVYE